MKNNKKSFRPLCYFGLFILFILLLLPPGLRIFGKNLYVKVEEKKDEVVILNCSKINESINSTFLNEEPQIIEYRIKGNYSDNSDEESKNPDEKVENTGTNTNIADMEKEDLVEEDNFMDVIKPHAKITYNSNENVTVFEVKVQDLKEVSDYAKIFNSFENQRQYFINQKFQCDKSIKYF